MSQSGALVAVDSGQEDVQLEGLAEAMREMPRDMLVFSTCMRSLYVDKAVGTNSQAARKFRKLRDDTRNDAMVYLKGILPVSQQLVSAIQDFFENYIDLDYEEWVESLHDIVEDVKGYKDICNAVVKMHEEILTPLKMREDQAKLVMSELKDLQREFEKRKRELERSAASKENWAFGLLFVPGVNLIACPLLKSSAETDIANAVAKGAEAQIQEASALAVANYLIPALKRFIKGLERAAGFFSLMESELGMFASKGEKSFDNPKKLHFKKMNKKAIELKSYCQKFMIALPSVRTDFEAIPTEGTDQNYVDRWLEKQKLIIAQSCIVKSAFKSIMSAIYKPTPEPKNRLVSP